MGGTAGRQAALTQIMRMIAEKPTQVAVLVPESPVGNAQLDRWVDEVMSEEETVAMSN